MPKIELFFFWKNYPSDSLKNRQELDFKIPDIRSQNGPQNTEIQPNEELKTHEITLNAPLC